MPFGIGEMVTHLLFLKLHIELRIGQMTLIIFHYMIIYSATWKCKYYRNNSMVKTTLALFQTQNHYQIMTCISLVKKSIKYQNYHILYSTG